MHKPYSGQAPAHWATGVRRARTSRSFLILLTGPPIWTAFGLGLISTSGNRNWTFCVTVLRLVWVVGFAVRRNSRVDYGCG